MVLLQKHLEKDSILITDYIKNELEKLGYFINYKVCDACFYNTPQYRKRCIFLISKIRKWEFPKENKPISVKEAIGDLPSLESGEDSGIKYNKALKHNDKHILWLKHTPTGNSALDNKIYFPEKTEEK